MRSKIIFILLWFLIWIPCFILTAKTGALHFDHVTIEQGLSDTSVSCLVQDRRGYIWIGTEKSGLNRYDGTAFKIYSHNPRDPHSLSSNSITTLMEDQQGFIWVGTINGLNRYQPGAGSFTRFKNNPHDPSSISGNQICSICQDRKGTIWIGTHDNGLNRFDDKNQCFEHFLHNPDDPNSLSHDHAAVLHPDKQECLWIGTGGGGLNKFIPYDNRWIHYRHQPDNPASLSHDQVTALFKDSKGYLWIGTMGGGLNRLDSRYGTFYRYIGTLSNPNSLRNNYIFSILEDLDHRFWVGTAYGIHEFIRASNEFIHYPHIPGDQRSFSLYAAEFIYEDRSGLLWMGSSVGINLLDKKRPVFSHLVDKHTIKDRHSPHSLSHNHVKAIHEDRDGIIWIGTWGGGLNAYDPERKTFTFFKDKPDHPRSISSKAVSCICDDLTGNLWIGTHSGLNHLNRADLTFSRYIHDPENPNSPAHNTINCLEKDQEGRIWIGTANGLDRLNPKTRGFRHFRQHPKSENSLSSNSITALCIDRRRHVWIGTSDSGLNRYDPVSHHFQHFISQPGNRAGLSDNHITHILETRGGAIWVGTANGLNMLNPEYGTFQRFSTEDGLPHHKISALVEDNQGNIWISTGNGISKLNPLEKTFRNYDSRDGLQRGEFTSACCLGQKGEMFFGGMNGFNSFFPGLVKDNPYIPPVVLTSITLHTRDTKDLKEIPVREEIKLSYRDSFSIGFTSLCFSDPSRNRYAYKIEELHDKWIQLGNKTEILFAGMEPGKYLLRIKGSNQDRIWNEKGTSIRLIITPPFWKTGWFRILAVLSIAFLFLIWHRTRMNSLAHRLKTETAVSQFLAKNEISQREREILKLLLSGKSNKEIENELFISPHTVKNHVYHIFRKLKVKSRGQLLGLFQEYLVSREE